MRSKRLFPTLAAVPVAALVAALGACLASAAALAHEGLHLPGMTHPHVETWHLLLVGALALAALGVLARRGGRRP